MHGAQGCSDAITQAAGVGLQINNWIAFGSARCEDCAPKGLVMDAWKASVGYSRDSACSQRLVTHAGTCRCTQHSQLVCMHSYESAPQLWGQLASPELPVAHGQQQTWESLRLTRFQCGISAARARQMVRTIHSVPHRLQVRHSWRLLGRITNSVLFLNGYPTDGDMAPYPDLICISHLAASKHEHAPGRIC